MKRDIYQKLKGWRRSGRRKPLILSGARQVGKTYSLQRFAENEYDDCLYLNFDEDPNLAAFFKEDRNPVRILADLSTYFKKPIKAAETLLIFDEIQECPNALNSLKYFCEKANEQHIVSAGSLLGVKFTKGFPVGKVNMLDLTPLGFFEFLDAVGESALRQLVEAQVDNIAEPFHNQLIKWLKHYYIVGGMPEAVAHYVQHKDVHQVRAIQKEILRTYDLDFAKHAPKETVMKIMTIWNSIPSQLAKENKKYIFSAISQSARAREYESAIQWLLDAGLILKSHSISTPLLPLSAYANQRSFKIYMLDTGLLGAMSQLDPRLVLEESALFKEFKGAFTENYVAQSLHQQYADALYYWTSEGRAEVDFVISFDMKIYPLEVKAGQSRHKKSLLEYGKKHLNSAYHEPLLSRTTLRNFSYNGNIVNYPLYAISLFPALTNQQHLSE